MSTEPSMHDRLSEVSGWVDIVLPKSPEPRYTYHDIRPTALTAVEAAIRLHATTKLLGRVADLERKVERLQDAIRWYDNGENTDAAIEIVCWETLRRGDMTE